MFISSVVDTDSSSNNRSDVVLFDTVCPNYLFLAFYIALENFLTLQIYCALLSFFPLFRIVPTLTVKKSVLWVDKLVNLLFLGLRMIFLHEGLGPHQFFRQGIEG
mgnify:CR=1 FL=1